MSTLNLEEYRQPWETGPHWNLKREFLEKYQNDFPKDRLLCLAQAYTNIELLNCTYPDPVMQEVLELSKSLHECKKIREAKVKVDQNSSKQQKRDERHLSEEPVFKPSKKVKCNPEKSYFINFCPAGQMADKISDISPSQNEVSKMDSMVLNVSHNSENTPYFDTNKNSSNVFNASNHKNDEKNYYILNLTRSSDISDIKIIAGHLKLTEGPPIGRLENAVNKLGFDKVRFDYTSSSPTAYMCYFYVGNTLISIGRDNNERSAKSKAAEYAVEILSNLQNLPCKTLNDLKSHWLKKDNFFSNHTICCGKGRKDTAGSVQFWFNFSQKVKKGCKNKKSKMILKNVAERLKSSIFVFSFTEDQNSAFNNRMFFCDLVLENTIICQAKDSSKRKAKTKALHDGLTCIFDLNKWFEEYFQKSNTCVDSDSTLIKDARNSDLKSSKTATPTNETVNYSDSEKEKRREAVLNIAENSENTSYSKSNMNTCKVFNNESKLSNSVKPNPEKSYFIKFCSGGLNTDEKSDISPSQTDVSEMDSALLNVSQNSETTPYSESNIYLKETISDAVMNYFNDESNPKSDDKQYYILNLTRSSDLSDMKSIADHLKSSSGDAIDRLENAAKKLGFDKVKFDYFPTQKMCCFYVGNTLISFKKENNEKLARKVAADYAVEILSNLENLPCKTLTDLKSHWINNDDFFSNHRICCMKESKDSDTADSDSRRFWFNFFESVKQKHEKMKDKTKMKQWERTKNILMNAAEKLNSSIFEFVFTEDPNSLPHNRMFRCDFVLENTLICHGMASSRKKAKTKALDDGLNFILGLSKWCEEFVLQSKSISSNSLLVTETPDVQQPCENSNHIPFSKTEEITERSIQRPFKLNDALLQNSYQKKFVLFDPSEVRKHNQTLFSVLQYSASLCRITINCETEEVEMPNNHLPACRYIILIGNEVVGSAIGLSKKEAKEKAASVALQNLKKMVYTIKVKNELVDASVIQRSHVIDMKGSSDALTNDNVGYKLLQKLGWSGGAIGIKGGITEPISAGRNNFHQGLGFSDESKNNDAFFRKNINALLKDFSQSNDIGSLIFSSDFSKDERADIHRIAQRYHLHTTSQNIGRERQLFVKRKISIEELLDYIVLAGGSTPKYEMLDCSQ